MGHGTHKTKAKPGDPTYSAKWSGVSYAPHCSYGCKCPTCGEALHLESDSHYCPYCDDFKSAGKGCPNR